MFEYDNNAVIPLAIHIENQIKAGNKEREDLDGEDRP